MSKPKDPIRMFDTRTIERNLKYGWLSRAELEKHLSALPDVAHKGVTLGEIEDRRGTASTEPSSRRTFLHSSTSRACCVHYRVKPST